MTLVSSDSTLFPSLPKALGASLHGKLTAANVTLVLGTRVEALESPTEPFAGQLKLDNGDVIEADLVFPVIGSRAVSDILKSLPGAEQSSANRIKTDGWMRPSALPNVFAAGDVADNGDEMTIVGTTRQLPWLIKMLTAVATGGRVEDSKPYTPWKKAPILLPLGPEKGASFLGVFTVGNLMTRLIKGKGLFLAKTHKLFNRPVS